MTELTYQGRTHAVAEGQTALDALLAAGEAIPNACLAGACGSCLLRVRSGEIPPGCQGGLREAWKALGYVYTCQCRPQGPLTLEPIGEGLWLDAAVVGREPLSASVTRVVLRLAEPADLMPGQYVTLHRGGVARSFSLASVTDGALLELHVRRLPGGAMSPYLCDEAAPGEPLVVQGPFGQCVYMPDRPEQPLLLAGTGTGLAPLWGVLHDALAAGHDGPIHLFHGALEPGGLYLVDDLRRLAARHPNLRYVPSVVSGATGEMEEGPLDAVVMRHLPKTTGVRVFLCGAPELVALLKRKVFLAGAALADIASDPFVSGAPPAKP